MTDRKLGPNMKRFLAYAVARKSIPPGGGMQAVINVLVTPGKLADVTREALKFCDDAIAAMRSAPDNPYGNDEETIAGAIVKELDRR